MASSPFRDVRFGNFGTITGVQQLFLLGALAIAMGIFTYSRRVMLTVGQNLMPLNPVAAWVVVVSHSLVLFIFSSTHLQSFLVDLGFPPLPLIPVSSSQAVIGAVLGIAFAQGRGKALRQVRWRVLLNIASGWVSTPVVAALVSFILLFVMQNVFQEQVYQPPEARFPAAEHSMVLVGGEQLLPLHPVRNQSEYGSIRRTMVDLPRGEVCFFVSVAELKHDRLHPYDSRRVQQEAGRGGPTGERRDAQNR